DLLLCCKAESPLKVKTFLAPPLLATSPEPTELEPELDELDLLFSEVGIQTLGKFYLSVHAKTCDCGNYVGNTPFGRRRIISSALKTLQSDVCTADCSNSLNGSGFWTDVYSSEETKEGEHGIKTELAYDEAFICKVPMSTVAHGSADRGKLNRSTGALTRPHTSTYSYRAVSELAVSELTRSERCCECAPQVL
ncbi:hypothetical protein STEG23_013339, partial [Scotinomys teguina]